ncbi:MAG: hypothetical protein WC291_09545 [Thermodesulfovibrionales bacterium]|jgi:hypothetical protein
MAFAVRSAEDGMQEFTIQDVKKGAWTHASPLSTPPGFAPAITNWDLPGGVPTTMNGDEVFLDGAYAAGTVNLLCDRRTISAQNYILAKQDATDGRVYVWVTNAWNTLRTGLTSTASPTYWTWLQYGSDLFITNPYDGVYRYDGDTLIPIGAKAIAQAEADEAALWTGETADTTNFREGLQSVYTESSGSAADLVYTPSTALNLTTPRLLATAYSLAATTGTDYIHFKVMFSNTGTIDTTNTRVLLTTSAGNTLNFPLTAWDSDRSGTAFTTSPVAGTWYDAYLKAADGTQAGTWNPASVTSLTFSVDTSAGTLRMNVDDIYVIYANTMPAVRYLAEWKNILFGAATTANEDTIYFSMVQGPDLYSTTANLPLKTRGEAITGLKNYFSQLTVGAENTTHSLSGSVQGYTYPAYIFDQQMVSREHGVSSHRSMVEANNKLYWWYKGMIIEYRGTGTTKISYPLDVTLATNNDSALDYIVGAAFRKKNQVWWTWRRSGESVNDRVLRYDYIEGALLPTEGLSTPLLYETWVSGTERLFTIDTTSRKVYRQDSTNLSFVGTAIEASLELPPLAIPKQAYDWLEAYIQYLTNTGTLTVSYRVADHLRALLAAAYSTSESITQSAAGELGRVLLGDRGSLFQLKLSTSGVKAQIQFPLVIYADPLDARIFV